MRGARVGALPLLFAATAGAAAGGTRTASFSVGAAIVTGCTVATDAGGRWGTIDLGTLPGAGTMTASGTLLAGGLAGIQLSCTPGAVVNVTADAGDHASDGQRRLVGSGSATVPYALYANGSTTAWTTQPVAVTFPLGASARTLPVRATATLAGPVAAGTYTDTVRITLSF